MSSQTSTTSCAAHDDGLADSHDGRTTISNDRLPIITVPISSLTLDGFPRLGGENREHTRLLATTNATLPPIAVHRPTMRVIDGMHRIQAALLNGKDTIQARLYDCSEEAAFVLAVEANITHGLPLSLVDRKAAAARIIATHPTWSDRAVSASTGLSDKTVSAIRERSTAKLPQSNSRLGRDGRVRPVNTARSRQRAAELLKARPDAALREIAKAAGLSLATASDVRERVRRNEDPVPRKYHGADASPRGPSRTVKGRSTAASTRDLTTRDRRASSMLTILKDDPSLKFNEPGRRMLRWLHQHIIEPKNWEKVVDTVPPHCTKIVAEMARECANTWSGFANKLEQRANAADCGDTHRHSSTHSLPSQHIRDMPEGLSSL